MRDFSNHDPASTRESRCGRVVLELGLKYGLWSARHADAPFQNNYRRRGRVHVDCIGAVAAGDQRDALGFAIRRAGAGAASVASRFASAFAAAGNAWTEALLNCGNCVAATFEKIISEAKSI